MNDTKIHFKRVEIPQNCEREAMRRITQQGRSPLRNGSCITHDTCDTRHGGIGLHDVVSQGGTGHSVPDKTSRVKKRTSPRSSSFILTACTNRRIVPLLNPPITCPIAEASETCSVFLR